MKNEWTEEVDRLRAENARLRRRTKADALINLHLKRNEVMYQEQIAHLRKVVHAWEAANGTVKSVTG